MNTVLNTILNTVLYTVLNMVWNTVLNMVSNMVLNIVLNMVLKMVSNTVLNINSCRNTYLISRKQFINLSFYITSFQGSCLRFSLRSSFILLNVSNFNKISEYSSSEMESSDNAFEMRLLLVLGDETANIAIFSISEESFLIA